MDSGPPPPPEHGHEHLGDVDSVGMDNGRQMPSRDPQLDHDPNNQGQAGLRVMSNRMDFHP